MFLNFSRKLRAGRMTQQVKVYPSKSDNMSSVPGFPYGKKGVLAMTGEPLLCCSLPSFVLSLVPPWTPTVHLKIRWESHLGIPMCVYVHMSSDAFRTQSCQIPGAEVSSKMGDRHRKIA